MKDYFSGELNGYTINDLYNMIDYRFAALENRIRVTKEIADTGFFEEYFDNHYDVNYNKSSPLAEDNNVCQLLDRLGTYILMSTEEKERRKLMEDVSYSTEYLINKINKEASLESIAIDTDMASTIIYNIKANDVSKIAKNKTIYISDLTKKNIGSIIDDVGIEDQEVIDIIYSYLDYYNSLSRSRQPKQKIDRIKMDVKRDIEELITKNIPSVQHNNLEYNSSNTYAPEPQDMTYKHKLLGVSFYNTQGSLEYEPGFLFYNREEGIDVNDELDLLLYDLDLTVKNSNLTERELKVLTYLRKGVSMGDIAERLNISTRTATRDKQKIVQKVLNTNRKTNKGD